MSEKIRDFFVKKPALDHATGETIIESIWGLFFHISDGVKKKFVNELFSLSGVFIYAEKGGKDKLMLRLDLTYYGDKTPYDILKKLSCEFIPDNNKGFTISDGTGYKVESSNLVFSHLHMERMNFEISLSDFLKLVNAGRISWKIAGLDEGEFDKMRIMDIKGVYNSIFDPEFETDLLNKYVDERQEELRKYREEEELKKKQKEQGVAEKKEKVVIPQEKKTTPSPEPKKQETKAKPNKFDAEENSKHENAIVELIKNNRVEDAVKYYESNFGVDTEAAKSKVKSLAEKNGMASIYNKYHNKQALIGFLGLLVVTGLIILLIKAC
jgi:hypothetical protein